MYQNELETTGFYTLTDERLHNASATSPLCRCEMILTDRCNFSCPYCRGLRDDISGEMSREDAFRTLKIWIDNGLKNVRFSGGEPLMYPHLLDLVRHCHENKVERIAISSNGSFPTERYVELAEAGVNDFSISLDSACCANGDLMSGTKGKWMKVVDNIKALSDLTYVTVGIVLTEDNETEARQTIELADSLGVRDIRVIPAAQRSQTLSAMGDFDSEFLERHPILKYRIGNAVAGRAIRGMSEDAPSSCYLALDDMAVAGGYHFPCIIYMREMGDPIGKMDDDVRNQRAEWVKNHDPRKDPICSKMCLDVCVHYNRRFEILRDE